MTTKVKQSLSEREGEILPKHGILNRSQHCEQTLERWMPIE